MKGEREACKFLFQRNCIDLARTDILQTEKPYLKTEKKNKKEGGQKCHRVRCQHRPKENPYAVHENISKSLKNYQQN